MSGYMHEVITRFTQPNPIKVEQVNQLFMQGLKDYFAHNEVEPKLEEKESEHYDYCYDVYFFLDVDGKERLYSFDLHYTTDDKGGLKYFAYIDDSREATTLFWEEPFFRAIIERLKGLGAVNKVIWLYDPVYMDVDALFEGKYLDGGPEKVLEFAAPP